MLAPSMHTQKSNNTVSSNKQQETESKPASRLYAQLLIKHQNAITEFHDKLQHVQNNFTELQHSKFAELKEQLTKNHEMTRLLLEDKESSYQAHKELLSRQREFSLSMENAEPSKNALDCKTDTSENNNNNIDIDTCNSTLFMDLYHSTIADLHTYNEDHVHDLIAQEWQRVVEIQSELTSNYNKRLALIENTQMYIRNAAIAHKIEIEKMVEEFMDVLLSINAIDINTIHVLAQQTLLQCNQEAYHHAQEVEEITETLRQREILLHHTRYLQRWSTIQKLFKETAWHSEMYFTAYWLQSSVFICHTHNDAISTTTNCKEHPELLHVREITKFINEVIVQYEALINGLIMFTNTLNESSSLNNELEHLWKRKVQILMDAQNSKDDSNDKNNKSSVIHDIMVSLLQIIRHAFPLCDGATSHGWLRVLHNCYELNGYKDTNTSETQITLDTETSAQLPRQAIWEVVDEWRMKALVFIRNTEERSKTLLLIQGQTREVEEIQERATAQLTRLASLKEWLSSLSLVEEAPENKEDTNIKENNHLIKKDEDHIEEDDDKDKEVMSRIQETIDIIHKRSNAFLHQVSHFVERVLIEESVHKQLLSEAITTIKTHNSIKDSVKNVDTSVKGKKGNIVKGKNIISTTTSSSSNSNTSGSTNNSNSKNSTIVVAEHVTIQHVCGVLVLLERVNHLLFSTFSELESLFIVHINNMIAERNDMLETLQKLEQRYLTLTEETIPNCTSSTQIQVYFRIGLDLLNEMQRLHQDYHASTHGRIRALQSSLLYTINKRIASMKVWIGVEEECDTIKRIEHQLQEYMHEADREMNEVHDKVEEKRKQRNKVQVHNSNEKRSDTNSHHNNNNIRNKKKNIRESVKKEQSEKSSHGSNSKKSRLGSSQQSPSADSSSSYSSEEEEEEEEEENLEWEEKLEEEEEKEENTVKHKKLFHIMSKYKQFTANDGNVYNIMATRIPLSVNEYYEKYYSNIYNNIYEYGCNQEGKVCESGSQESTMDANEDEVTNAMQELQKILLLELEEEQQKEQLESQEWYQSLPESDKEKLNLNFLQHSYANEEHEEEEEGEEYQECLENKKNSSIGSNRKNNKSNKVKSAASTKSKEENEEVHTEHEISKKQNNTDINNSNNNELMTKRTSATLYNNPHSQELHPWMISCISNLFVKTSTQNNETNTCNVYVISKWHHSLQITLLNWALCLQEKLQTHFIPNAMNYLQSMVDQMTSNVMRHHRFRPAALQSNVVEVRQRQLERVIHNEETLLQSMHHSLNEIESAWHTRLNEKLENEWQIVTRQSKELLEHEMHRANSLMHLNTVRDKHSELLTSALSKFITSIKEELYEQATLRELSMLQTQCDDLIARETNVDIVIDSSDNNLNDTTNNNNNNVNKVKKKKKSAVSNSERTTKHEKQQRPQKDVKNITIQENKKNENEEESEKDQNELATCHAKYIRHLHELRDRLIETQNKITNEYNVVYNNYTNNNLENLRVACQQAYSKHLAEIQFIDHIHELVWKMKRESHKLLVAPTTCREEEIVEMITQVENNITIEKRNKKWKCKFDPAAYFLHMTSNTSSSDNDDNKNKSKSKNKRKDKSNLNNVRKSKKPHEKSEKKFNNEFVVHESQLQGQSIQEKMKEKLLECNVLFEEQLWNESSAVRILHLLDKLRFMLFTQYTWLTMSSTKDSIQTWKNKFIALPLRIRVSNSTSSGNKNTLTNISNTYITIEQNNSEHYTNSNNGYNYKYVIEPLPIAVEQMDWYDEKENANTQEENATVHANAGGTTTTKRKSSAKAKRSLVMAKVENELQLANSINLTMSSNSSNNSNKIKTNKIDDTVSKTANKIDQVCNSEEEQSTQIIVQDRFSRVHDYVLVDVNHLTSSIFTGEMNDKIAKPILAEAEHAIHNFFMKWTEIGNTTNHVNESVGDVQDSNLSKETNIENEMEDHNRKASKLHVPTISRSLHSLVPDKNEVNKCHYFTEEEISVQFNEEIAKQESRLATRLQNFQELLWTQLRYLSSILLPTVPLALTYSLFSMSLAHTQELLKIILTNFFQYSQQERKQEKEQSFQETNEDITIENKQSDMVKRRPFVLAKPENEMMCDWYWQQALIVLQDAYYIYTLRSYTLAQSFLCLLKSFATSGELNTFQTNMSNVEDKSNNCKRTSECTQTSTSTKRGIRYLLEQKNNQHLQKREISKEKEQNEVNAAEHNKDKIKEKHKNEKQEDKEDRSNNYQSGILLDQTWNCITQYNKLHPEHVIQSSVRKLFDEYFCEEVQFGNTNPLSNNNEGIDGNTNKYKSNNLEKDSKQTRRTSLLSASESESSSSMLTSGNAKRTHTNKSGSNTSDSSINNKEKKNINTVSGNSTGRRQGKRAAAEEEKLLKAQEEQLKMLELLEQQKLESELNARRQEVLMTTIRQLRTPSFITPSCDAGKEMLKCVHSYADKFYENMEAMGNAINTLFTKCK